MQIHLNPPLYRQLQRFQRRYTWSLLNCPQKKVYPIYPEVYIILQTFSQLRVKVSNFEGIAYTAGFRSPPQRRPNNHQKAGILGWKKHRGGGIGWIGWDFRSEPMLRFPHESRVIPGIQSDFIPRIVLIVLNPFTKKGKSMKIHYLRTCQLNLLTTF